MNRLEGVSFRRIEKYLFQKKWSAEKGLGKWGYPRSGFGGVRPWLLVGDADGGAGRAPVGRLRSPEGMAFLPGL